MQTTAFRATNGRYPTLEEMPELEGVSFSEVPGAFAAPITESFDSFLILDSYDPAPVLRRTLIPVLALNGSRDLQVLADLNLPPIE
jgi:fermentation-respiration switch protein FrsA (DUF1100 family)